jgi:Flp pilus assembly protein TadG
MGKRLLALCKDERGGVFIFVGVVLIVLLTGIAVSLEMGRMFYMRSKAVHALDSALLAAAQNIDNSMPIAQQQASVDAIAKSFFTENFPNAPAGVTSTGWSVTCDATCGSIQGSLQMNLPTIFGGFLGVDTIPITLDSKVERSVIGSLEIAFALDITGSMCFDQYDNYARANCYSNLGKMKAMRDGVEILVNTLDAAAASSGIPVYYASVPYKHTVRVNGVVTHNYDLFTGGFDPFVQLPSLTGLRSNGHDIVASLDNTMANMAKLGTTNGSIGLYWAWLALRSESIAKFQGVSAHELSAQHPAPINTPGVYKILIFMTDGGNTIEGFDGFDLTYKDDLNSDANIADMCAAIRKEGIEIFTVGVMIPDYDAWRAIPLLREDCAHEATDPGHYYELSSPDDFKPAIEKIASSFLGYRIVK